MEGVFLPYAICGVFDTQELVVPRYGGYVDDFCRLRVSGKSYAFVVLTPFN